MARTKSIEIDTRSLNDILKTLDDISTLSQKQVATAAKLGAKYVQKKAKAKAPVSQDGSHGKARGFLKKNIKIRGEKSATAGKKVYTVGFGGEAFYGIFLEYGTYNIQARPFLRPALESSRDELVRMMLGEIAKGVDKVK